MGGFGALAFAGALPICDTALAFAPQSSIHPSIAPFDTRWVQYARQVKQWDVPDAAALLRDGVRYRIYIGALSAEDRLHAERCITSDIELNAIADATHNVATVLKLGGQLELLFDELVR